MKILSSFAVMVLMLSGISRAQTLIYSENFASGINASWSNTGISAGSPNSYAKWRYTHTGSHGAYGSPTDFINSPTKANGFIIFDSDSLDNGGVAGAFGLGPAPAPQIASLTTSAINVTGTPYCKLNFYQYYRNFQSTTVVGISTDSVNWTLDTINSSLGVNGATASSSQVSVDLSPVILRGGPANKVYIMFLIYADYYYWMIDDISITTLPANDLSALSLQGHTGNNGLGLFYASIPASEADSVLITSSFGNVGIATQTHVSAGFSLSDNGTAVGSAVSSPVLAQLPYGTDSSGSHEFQTQGIGQYQVAVNIISDSTDAMPTNNLDTLTFEVTDSVFSINTTTAQNASSYFLLRNNAGLSLRLGTLFQLDHADTVTSVTTAFAGGTLGTHAGTIAQATIYPVTVGANSISYGSPAVLTYTKTLVAADITGTTGAVRPVTMQIDNSSGNAILSPGTYWVAIGALSTPDSNVLLCSTAYQANGFPVVEQNGTLFYLSSTDAAYCNLNFGHPSSLLTVYWTRSPVTSPVNTGQNVAFTVHSNASSAATYSWTMTGSSTGVIYTGSGNIVTQPFTVADTFNVCVTVTDGANSVTYCNTIRVVGSSIGSVSTVQSCNGGTTAIIPLPGSVAGFAPGDSLQPCISQGIPVSDTIYFTNYTTLTYMGIPITMNSLTFDSIYLPTGLCWSTNSPTNTFAGGQSGVIYITGTTYDSPGQYKMKIIVTANTNLATLSHVNAEAYVGVRYRLRIKCPAEPCPTMDNSHADSALYYVAYANCGGTLPSATISSSGPDAFCAGGSVVLTAGGGAGYTYHWSTGATTQSIPVTTSAAYVLTVHSGSDSAIAQQIVTVYPPPSVTISPANGNVCQGHPITLSASGSGSIYSWSTGGSGTAITVVPSSQSTYTVTAMSSNGCTASSIATVTISQVPAPQSIVGNPTITPFQFYPYSVSIVPGISYTWYVVNGAIQTGQGTNSITVQWAGTGPYSISVLQSTGSGCSDTSTLFIFATGVTEQSTDAIRVYPNPTTGKVYFDGLNSGSSIDVFDMLGQSVYHTTADRGRYTITLDGQAKGIYNYRIAERGMMVKLGKITLQ